MTEAALKHGLRQPETQDIVIDELFPHAPEVLWRTLTTGDIIGRWLMVPSGFDAVVGNRFTYQTTASGAWDGVIHCEVLEVVPNRRFTYAWTSGHDSIATGYGARLETVVTFTLTPEGNGTRLKLVHAGFVVPRNEAACQNMRKGWQKILGNLGSFTETKH